MGHTKADDKKTTHWAMGSLGSGGYKAAVSFFELCNLETGRAHTVMFMGVGMDTLLGSASASLPSYTRFQTTKAVNFLDFHGKPAVCASIGAIVYGGVGLKVWDYEAAVKPFASVDMEGWGISIPHAGLYSGGLGVQFGSGSRSANNVPLILNIEFKDERTTPLVSIRSKGSEDPRIVLPADVLFDFDKAVLKPKAEEILLETAHFFYRHSKSFNTKILIEGHTDSKGSDSYNKDLSERRAKAVKNWLVENNIFDDSKYKVVGKGEKDPLEPNKKADGSDNPEGRKNNRRVEFKLLRSKQ